jgi:hypothetical protein
MCRFRASGGAAALFRLCRASRVARVCRATALVLLAAIAAPACRAGSDVSLDELARRYVRLAVALGERDPDSLDFYAGPADAVADVRRAPPPLTAIKRDAQRLTEQLAARHDAGPVAGGRVAALRRDLSAIVARVDLIAGARPQFDQESAAFFDVVPGSVDEARLESIRARIAAAIGGSGRLVDRYAAFSGRFVVPPDRLRAVMEAALDACRQATLAHVDLPAGENARIDFVSDKPWSAFSQYLGGGRSAIRINTDFRFTIDQALQVACHEGYPGHHARNALRSAGDGGRWPERAVQLTFSPGSLQSEASAMVAGDVAFDADSRLRAERDRLFPIAGLAPDGAASHIEIERLVGELQIVQGDIARRYLDGQLEFARAVNELETRALVPHAEALAKYINEYRSYITTYTEGRRRVSAQLIACIGDDTSDQNRWRCFKNVTAPR